MLGKAHVEPCVDWTAAGSNAQAERTKEAPSHPLERLEAGCCTTSAINSCRPSRADAVVHVKVKYRHTRRWWGDPLQQDRSPCSRQPTGAALVRSAMLGAVVLGSMVVAYKAVGHDELAQKQSRSIACLNTGAY